MYFFSRVFELRYIGFVKIVVRKFTLALEAVVKAWVQMD